MNHASSGSARRRLQYWFPLTLKDTATAALIFACSCLLCYALQQVVPDSDTHVPMIFLLAVLLISRYTDGYFYGILASMLGTIVANYVFTYPYFVLNFTLSGYPLCFTVMATGSALTCALTARLKTAEKLRHETEQEKMRANLLRAVSHDLRTPLTSIMGAISAVIENRDHLEPESADRLLSDARDDAQWLIRIVENLLSITRMGGQAAEIRTDLELGEEIIAEAVAGFKKRFPDPVVRVSVPEEPLFIPMDGTLIEQVIINILENAVLHGKTTRRIDLSLTKEGNEALFVIRDDGAGIDEDALPNLFSGYFAHSDDTRNMGIGLSVCMSIITAHHGTMTAENATGGGARFLFRLPLSE